MAATARREALLEGARARAASGAMAARAAEIAAGLELRAGALDAVFRFGALMEHRGGFTVAPPVVARSDGASRIEGEGGRAAVSARHVWRVARPARVVARVPHWRDYLVRAWPAPGPAPVLQPRTAEERAAVAAAEAEGRAEGAALADAVHAEDWDRLERDWLGMVEWRRLRAAGMAAPAEVFVSREAVSGGGARMAVDVSRVRIGAGARLNPAMEVWRPAARAAAGDGDRAGPAEGGR